MSSPRSIVFTVFGDYLRYCGEGEAPLAALSQILGMFGIEPGTTRVVMTRLKKEGWFDTRRQGREVSYVLSSKGWNLLNEGLDRIFKRWDTEWDRQWSMVLVKFSETQRAARDDARRRLIWEGFGQLSTSTWMSPHDNLDAAQSALSKLPLINLDLLRCSSQGLAHDRDIASRCWDLSDVQSDYTSFIDEFSVTPNFTGIDALKRRIELTDDYRHFPFRDPDLPRELLPAGWTGRRAHEVFTSVHSRLRAEAEAAIEQITGMPVLGSADLSVPKK
jgi:phenylacetic acid degradation operon negative regulatory protein